MLQYKMSNLPKTPQKRRSHCKNINILEFNCNSNSNICKQQSANNFIVWYKYKIDNQNLTTYLSDDVTLEWFGRTIKTRKKVSSFVKTEIQNSRHDFISIESIDKIPPRNERLQRKICTSLMSPPPSPEISEQEQKCMKRKLEICHSPQWAEGCGPQTESEPINKKRKAEQNDLREITEISNKGDGLDKTSNKSAITPPNMECGQGDCLPSTSGTNPNSKNSDFQEPLNQLPKLAVECKGFIQLTRTKNDWSSDSVKWDRKCKVQISYSEDPLNIGEYIVWFLRYSDVSSCRRNLLSAFEQEDACE